jgi:tryptophan 7-halogenase
VEIYNRFVGESWDEVRDFIALHYRFNRRFETPFWRTCLAETDLGNAQPLVDFYLENGPTAIHQPLLLRQSSAFGMEGYLALLVGQKVSHQKPHRPTARELEIWQQQNRELGAAADRGLTVRDGLDLVRRSDAQWAVK